MYLVLNQQKSLLEQIYPDMKLFNLSYQSRPDSRQYLENIDSTKSNSNIDYYHMFNASAVITDFLKKTTLGGWRFVDAIVNANNTESACPFCTKIFRVFREKCLAENLLILDRNAVNVVS